MKKHFTLLWLVLMGTASAWAQWDLGLGVGLHSFHPPKGQLDERFRLPDGGATLVPSVFVTWQSTPKRWYGLEGYPVERYTWFVDDELEEDVAQRERAWGLRLLAGNTWPVSDNFSVLTASGFHAEWILSRDYFSRVFWVERKYNQAFGDIRYTRIGAFFEFAGRLEAPHLLGMWFFRFEVDAIVTDTRPFDRNRYLSFTTGLRIPVLSIRKKDLTDE